MRNIVARARFDHLNHHGNHIIMQKDGKCERSGARECRLENALGREALPFFRVKWLPRSPKEGLCFRGFAARSGKVIDKKCA